MVVRTFYLANADAKAVANTLKNILKFKDIAVDEKLNMLVVRDSPEAIQLAEKLVSLHDVPEPEVMMEVEILEIKRTRLLDLGIQWPDSLTLTPLPAASGGTLTLRDLRGNFNGGTIGAGISPVIVNANKTDTDANLLANPRIRARNHEKAKILIGDRGPNITSTSTSTGFVSESVNYVDVGLKLDVEPTIYLDGEVAIKVALEVSNIVSQLTTKSGSVAYRIGTRNASTVLRLKDGENQVLAGLINDDDRSTAAKVPSVGELPVLGRFFGAATDNNEKTEIVLSITPHIIRNVLRPEARMSEFQSGTGNSFRLRPDTAPLGPLQNTADPAPAANHPGPRNATAPNQHADQRQNAAGVLQWQGPAQVKVGDNFAVQVLLSSDQPVTGATLNIAFDNKVLQVVGITEGEFLKQGGVQTTFSSRADANGQLVISNNRVGNGGATTQATLATVAFHAVAPTVATSLQVVATVPTAGTGLALPALPVSPYVVRVQQ
jgi:general secretion pathway protein D